MSLIGTLRPLIEDCPPSAEMCSFLSHHCKDQSSLPVINDSLVHTITRILKHNFVSDIVIIGCAISRFWHRTSDINFSLFFFQDFAKILMARTLVQDYIKALYTQDQGGESIIYFLSKWDVDYWFLINPNWQCHVVSYFLFIESTVPALCAHITGYYRT